MPYYINLLESRWTTREVDPDDSWDAGDYDGSVDGITVHEVGDSYHASYNGDTTDLEFPFYVVYASYSTGNTFGRDFACTVVGTVKTEDEAVSLSEAAENAKDWTFECDGREYHASWLGYFESLESVNYEEVTGLTQKNRYRR